MYVLLFTIAIDGPAGSGKSTTARAVAQALGFQHLDTGAMYRAVTYLALKNNCSLQDSVALTALAETAIVVFENTGDTDRVSVNGEDVTSAIRSPEVNGKVSEVATHASVRVALVKLQRKFAAEHQNIVAEGRDIGTVVFPDANLKVYLDASIQERARRRELEMREKGLVTTATEQEAELQRRDAIDSGREASPMFQADDAVALDTSGMTIAEQVAEVVRLARERMK
ncbi:(d)CMP kinase [Gemmatimonas aurantiaca]|nr:(d)CMP kinase [Gemmatimonas aurantiaca]